MTEPHPTAIVVTHRTKPGQRDATVEVWMAHMPAAVTAYPGHLAYFYTTIGPLLAGAPEVSQSALVWQAVTAQ